MELGEQNVVKNSVAVSERIVRSALIAIAGMAQIYDWNKSGSDCGSDDDEPSGETTTFNAEAHHADAHISDQAEMLFSGKPKKYTAMFKEINWVT